jgi:hypothetical protein
MSPQAFYLWDIGVKRGDIRLLGVGSYAAPVLSTLILVAGPAPDMGIPATPKPPSRPGSPPGRRRR